MQFKLGKKPPVHDERTLLFGAYLAPSLPQPPAAVNYGSKVKAWPMYDNDRYGDCTCAAAGHMIQNWTASAGKQVTPPDATVLRLYEHFVGTPPPPDEGCNMLDVLKYWRKHGLDRHKITAFAALEPNNKVQLRDAIYMFGSAYIGVALPEFAVSGDMLTIPWQVPPQGPVGKAAPNQNNGHCIPAVGYDARNVYVITWGEMKAMSWRFYDAYADESFAVLSTDWKTADGTPVTGFSFDALERDLAIIHQQKEKAAAAVTAGGGGAA
jgi:hypothetical protein